MVATIRIRWRWFAAFSAVLCGFGLLFFLATRATHHIDFDHFQLIKSGMTETEVEAIFGVPAGDYDGVIQDKNLAITKVLPLPADIDDKIDTNQLSFSGRTMFISSRHGKDVVVKSWFSRDGVYHVAFDNRARVVATGL